MGEPMTDRTPSPHGDTAPYEKVMCGTETCPLYAMAVDGMAWNRRAVAVVEAVPSPDTKRLQHLEDWLDGFEFVHLPTQIEPEVRCDWFAGDGSGHWFTQGKTFREAIDKSLNHEATQEAND